MGFLRVALRPARRPITPPPVRADQTLERQPHTSRGPRPRPPRILGARAPRPRRRRPGRRLPVSPARPTPRPPTPSPRAARRPTPPSQASTSRPKQRAQPYGPRPSSHNLFFSGFPQFPQFAETLEPAAHTSAATLKLRRHKSSPAQHRPDPLARLDPREAREKAPTQVKPRMQKGRPHHPLQNQPHALRREGGKRGQPAQEPGDDEEPHRGRESRVRGGPGERDPDQPAARRFAERVPKGSVASLAFKA